MLTQKVSCSFTELIARGVNLLQPPSALRHGAPASEVQLLIHKLCLQSHTEPLRHVALAETRPFLSLRLSRNVPYRILELQINRSGLIVPEARQRNGLLKSTEWVET